MRKSNAQLTIISGDSCETGECVDANRLFEKPYDEIIFYRSELQGALEGNRAPLFTCYCCNQNVRIRSRKRNNGESKIATFHFAIFTMARSVLIKQIIPSLKKKLTGLSIME